MGFCAHVLPPPPVRSVPSAAVAALFYNFLHVTLMIVAIDGFRRWSYQLLITPVIVHLCFGLIVSVINESEYMRWGFGRSGYHAWPPHTTLVVTTSTVQTAPPD